MSVRKTSGKFIGAALTSAIAASLCCITPVLAIISGSSGLASTFSWIEPARPFLISASLLALSIAWYKKIKPKTVDECGCEVNATKQKFIHTKNFLGIVTIFAIAMSAFPYYSKAFFSENEKQVIISDQATIYNADFKITGMTCASCAEHIKYEINKLDGIIKVDASHENNDAQVWFDNAKTNVLEIETAINSTGYTIIQTTIKN